MSTRKIGMFFATTLILNFLPLGVPQAFADSSDRAVATATSSSKSTPKGLRRAAANKMKTQGLRSAPNTATLTAKKKVAKKKATLAATTGRPPPFLEFPNSNLASLFWSDGVIENIAAENASENDCNEFIHSSEDGGSAGIMGCYMTQEVGRALENVLQSANSICYMSGLPTLSSGLELQKGSYPDNNKLKLFSPPTNDQDRLVKVSSIGEMGQEKIFLNILSRKTNAENGNAYAHKIWFCNADDQTANSYEEAEVKPNGRYIGRSVGVDEHSGGTYQSTISATITMNNGKVVFDSTQPREAESVFVRDEGSFKSELTIAGDIMRNKSYDSFGDLDRLAYSVARFTGATLPELRFLEGAYKDNNHSEAAVVEYRGSRYVSSNSSNKLRTALGSVDIDSDEFYANEPELNINLEDYPCDAEADIELTLNFDSEAMSALSAKCEGVRLDGMDFCREDEAVGEALNHFESQCMLMPEE